ncbi:MAG: hypothetical protein K0S63_843 [Gammaproteobacteria bacterium]|jgi:hypothetical protein|nr:hypothetical protein [Gammaproteobacteria bacterium]
MQTVESCIKKLENLLENEKIFPVFTDLKNNIKKIRKAFAELHCSIKSENDFSCEIYYENIERCYIEFRSQIIQFKNNKIQYLEQFNSQPSVLKAMGELAGRLFGFILGGICATIIASSMSPSIGSVFLAWGITMGVTLLWFYFCSMVFHSTERNVLTLLHFAEMELCNASKELSKELTKIINSNNDDQILQKNKIRRITL